MWEKRARLALEATWERPDREATLPEVKIEESVGLAPPSLVLQRNSEKPEALGLSPLCQSVPPRGREPYSEQVC